MQEAGGLADMLRQIGEEGDDVVLHLALDGVDAIDLEPALLPDRLGRGLRNESERGHGIAGMRLDLEPDAEPVLRLPDRRHLRPAVAGNHRDLLLRRRATPRLTDPTRKRVSTERCRAPDSRAVAAVHSAALRGTRRP